MDKRVSFSGLNLELSEVAQHHSDTENALKAYYGIESQREFLPAKFISYSVEEVSIEFHTIGFHKSQSYQTCQVFKT
jgi:hypothetical protein